MPITKASGQAVAVAAKGDLVVGSATNDAAVLGVGSANQVLTVDSSTTTGLKWATPASGGMTLISTTTLSGASVTLSSIPSTYYELRLIVRNYKPATDGAAFSIRANGDSNANRYFSAVNPTAGGAFNDTAYRISTGYENDNSVASGLIDIHFPDYANSTTWKMVCGDLLLTDPNNTSWCNITNFIGGYNQTTAISSLVLLCSTGNFTSGEVLLYGVK